MTLQKSAIIQTHKGKKKQNVQQKNRHITKSSAVFRGSSSTVTKSVSACTKNGEKI